MRQIKFRGKRVDNGDWVEGSYHYSADGKYHYILALEKFNERVGKEMMLHTAEVNLIDPATVGQFTGLIDKNGKEIWEGDILFCHEYDSSDCGHMIVQTFKNAVVGFGSGSYYYYPKGNMKMPHQLLMYAYEPEIIGNIHDNHSLLTNK